jgi:hypothetical protein
MKRLLALCLIAGCGVSTPGASDDPNGPGGADGSGDAGGAGGNPFKSGPFKTDPYPIVNQVDITAEVFLPGQAEIVVSTLRELSTDPAHALITLASAAGVPAVGTLYNLLPGIITDQLEGWINTEIAKVKINGVSITSYAGQIAGLADTALSHFTVDSELSFHDQIATHRITALDLTPTGINYKLPIGGLAGDLLSQDASVFLAKTGSVKLGEQHFGLEYGEYAWEGLDAASQALFGNDIRGALGNAINCPNLAHHIADKCIFTVCVGHQAELTAICEGGLDAIVNFAHDRMAALRLDVLHLASGQGQLVDDNGDGAFDRITGGTWQAELNLGLGLRPTTASFASAP